jgi:hypothetical protein
MIVWKFRVVEKTGSHPFHVEIGRQGCSYALLQGFRTRPEAEAFAEAERKRYNVEARGAAQ